jgi:hypothetical protein
MRVHMGRMGGAAEPIGENAIAPIGRFRVAHEEPEGAYFFQWGAASGIRT